MRVAEARTLFGDPPQPLISAYPRGVTMGARFRFIHCADLHLGARFRGVSETDPARAEALRESVFASFRRIVDTGISEDADAMFIAGDAFDEETITPMTRMFLVDELRRFGRPVFICRGNHDPHTSWESSMPYPDNVVEFGTEPERFDIPGVEGAEAVGASFADWHDERNLPSMIRGSPDRFTVACVHCDVDNPSPEYAYSPCTRSDLLGKGVDYWALGHIHRREVISERPWAVYPGNIQGRSFRETGEKGAYLVTVRDGAVAEARFFATQGVRWHDETVDIGGKTFDDLVSEISSRVPRGSALRVTLTGSGDLDGMVRRPDIVGLLSSRLGCTVSSVVAETTPGVDLDSRRGGLDMMGMVISRGDSLREGGRDAVLAKLRDNPVLKARIDAFEAMSDEELLSLVDSAVMSLASRMEASR